MIKRYLLIILLFLSLSFLIAAVPGIVGMMSCVGNSGNKSGGGNGESCNTVLTSYSSGDAAQKFGNSSSSKYAAYRFTPGKDASPCKFRLDIYRVGNPATQNITLEIWDDNSSEPGSIIANGLSDTVISTDDFPAQGTYVNYLYSILPSLSNGSYYWMVVIIAGSGDLGNNGNCLAWWANDSTGDANQYFAYSEDGSTWTTEQNACGDYISYE